MHSESLLASEFKIVAAQICEMGFPREDVVRALRAAFHNPDRAVEYLMTGIPEGLEAPQQATGGAAGVDFYTCLCLLA